LILCEGENWIKGDYAQNGNSLIVGYRKKQKNSGEPPSIERYPG